MFELANSMKPSIYKFLSVWVKVLHSRRHLLAQQSTVESPVGDGVSGAVGSVGPVF